MFAHRVPPWLTISIIASCGLIAAMHFTLIIPLFADLPTLLDVSSENASWLITATLLCSAVSTPIVARMGDMYGKRRMMIVALAVMIVGSVICALEVGFAMLIVGRAMHGFSAALIAVGISILRDELPPNKVGTAVALMSGTLGIGGALGLPLSGIIYDQFGWHSLFWFSAAAGTILITAITLLIEESSVRTPGRFDLVGAALFSFGLVFLLLPISKGSEWGWTSWIVIGLLGLSVLTFAVWLPVQLQQKQPMIDVRVARQPSVLITNIASLFVGFAMFVNMILTSQVLQLPEVTGAGLGLNASQAGLAMVPMGLVMLVMAPVCGKMLRHLGGRVTLVIGSVVMAVSYVGRAMFDGNLFEIVLGSTLIGVGTAIAFAAMPTLVMAAVPITETTSANGLNSLARHIGTATGSAVCAVILATYTVDIDGEAVASDVGVEVVLWVAAAVALIAGVIGLAIPASKPLSAAERERDQCKKEAVVRGQFWLGDRQMKGRPAFISVLALDGSEVDWNRADVDGSYSVVLPGPGTYVFTASALGCQPTAQIVDVDDGERGPDLVLESELSIHGRVHAYATPVKAAVVSLLRPDGELARSTQCDTDGWYRIPLPPPGPYVLIAFDPTSRASASHKLVVPVESVSVDLELS